MIRLRNLREEAGKTQAQIAEKLKISRQVYSNYENEINQPPLQLLIAMADYFQCSLDYLLGRSDDLDNVTVLPDYAYNETLSAEERTLLKEFRQLSKTDQQTLIEYGCFLKDKHKL